MKGFESTLKLFQLSELFSLADGTITEMAVTTITNTTFPLTIAVTVSVTVTTIVTSIVVYS